MNQHPKGRSLTGLIFKGLGAVLFFLVIILVFNTIQFPSKQMTPEKPDEISFDLKKVAERLAGGLRFQTISHQESDKLDPEAFFGFYRYLEEQFPLVHSVLEKEVVGQLSLLYTWKGSNSQLKPLILMSHTDVVPAEPGVKNQWKYPPFSGTVAEGYIWGRGALDVKGTLFATMEAVEMMISQGKIPQRTIYLAFGHDEEVGGKKGNAKIADLLKQRGIQPELVVDEGLPIVYNMVPGTSKPLAGIGIMEKGYLCLTLTVREEGGHSSMPPRHTAIGILCEAVQRLENNPFPVSFDGPEKQMFDFIAPEMSFPTRMLFANLWLFQPLIEKKLTSSPPSNALLRTTTAVTMIEGGIKENVLPQKASATVNFRMRAGETIQTVLDHVRKTIDNPNIEITKTGFIEKKPTPVNNTESKSFQMMQKTIHQIFPDAIVAPGIVIGGTDSQYYTEISENILLFFPWRLTKEDLAGIHGVNERLSVENYGEAIRFYYQLIRNAAFSGMYLTE